MSPRQPGSFGKATWLFGGILLTAAISGYFMGLRQTRSQISMTRPVSLVSPERERGAVLATNAVPVAIPYWAEDRLKDGPNAAWRSTVGNLIQPPAPAATPTNATPAERDAALQSRAVRRAFDGAPPVVPHPIAQDSTAACLVCHGQGLQVKDRFASKISHAPFANCTQCHVPAVGTGIPGAQPPLLEPIAGNGFVSVSPPRGGSRAWPGAPPTVPHSTWMRSDCMSCHGPRGPFGLRTPHPDRQSCVQCHALDASLDPVDLAAVPPALASPRPLPGSKGSSSVPAAVVPLAGTTAPVSR